MIPKIFHLFWSGGPISYLRYVTFLTLRKHHPNWSIKLHVANSFGSASWPQDAIFQDFSKNITKDYYPMVKNIVNEVCLYDRHPNDAPNYQSDFFRWDILAEQGGFYLDTDQVILKPFDDLICHRFIYSEYMCRNNTLHYTPVGVIGAETGLELTKHIQATIASYYTTNYNSIGPFMFLSVIGKRPDLLSSIDAFNSGKFLFYPIFDSEDVGAIYSGSFSPPKESYALHWFGGHWRSQEFNASYSEEKTLTGNDSISKILRNEK